MAGAAGNHQSGTLRKNGLLLGLVCLGALAAGIGMPQFLRDELPARDPAEPKAAAVDDPLVYKPPAWPQSPDPRHLLLRLGLGTVIVLGLCVGTLWFGRRWLSAPGPAPGAVGQLRILEVLPLAPRCTLYLLDAAGRQLVAGVDGSGLRSLVLLPDRFDAALGELPALPPGAPPGDSVAA